MLKIEPIPDVPEGTVKVAKAAFPKGNPYMQMRDELGTLYKNEMFLDLYSLKGQPAVAPWRLALITVMQYAENLSDRQAAEAVRARIDWKYALSLELEDEGFDYSVLSDFRRRLVENEGAQRLLSEMVREFKDKGLLKGRGQQRTDSTHVLSAVRELNRLENVGETLRHALESLAVAAPEWLMGWLPEEWFDRYGKRIEQYRLPKSVKDRDERAVEIGEDGYDLLKRIDEEMAEWSWLREIPAVQTLRMVWIQQYWCDNGEVKQRKTQSMPPVSKSIRTPYDTEARYTTKRSMGWTGYRVHVTESCDESGPPLITHVETTEATTQDCEMTLEIEKDLVQNGLAPNELLVDAGYVDAENLAESEKRYGIDLIGPTRPDTSWQAREGGLDRMQFTIDWQNRSATCPAGHTSMAWVEGKSQYNALVIRVNFNPRDCEACPLRPQCTRGTKRSLTLRPREQHEALQSARERENTDVFRAKIRKRAGVEGTLSQAVRVCGMRQSRYVGLAKTHLHCVASAAAVNLIRIVNWFNDTPLSRTRTSRLSSLAA